MKRHWPFFAPLAQWLEQMTHNHPVAGSSPAGRTNDSQTHPMITVKMNPIVYAGLNKFAQKQVKYGADLDRDEIHIIADVCCEEYDVSPSKFRGKTKTADLSDARKVFFYLCRKELYTFTCKRLGMYTGRDHSTVVFAVRRASELLEVDPTFRAKYNNARTLARQRLKINGYEFRRPNADVRH